MKTITVTSCLTTGLDPALAKVSTIEVADKSIGEGTFGIAYRAGRFDGRPVTPQVVKILSEIGPGFAQHGFDTIRELQKRIEIENGNASGKLLQKFPALQAVPQLSFEGRLDGRAVLGYSSNDLTSRGFDEFGHILDDDAKNRAFQALPISAKMRIAAELVSAFDFLSSRIRFIHADFKAEALFVDMRGMHCAVIDFDSGALARNASDSPTTSGTPQEWLAPEITKQLAAQTNGNRFIKVNLLSDVWSINLAVHALLVGVNPLFFLNEISDRSIDAYFQQYQWPAVDKNFRYFRKEVAAAYPLYSAFLKKGVDPQIVQRLAFTINRGYRVPSERTSYSQWKSVLGALNQPGIRQFAPDRLVVTDGRPVHFTWDVVGAAKLELTGVGDVTGRTSADVRVTRDTRFDLVLTQNNGAKMMKSVNVTVVKTPPVIGAFATSIALLKNATPARLTWNVAGAARLQIDNGVGDVTLQNHADVLPRVTTTYTLTATSYFGITATATVEIRVSDLAPAIAYFRADTTLLEEGRSLTLRWDVSPDAHEVTISGLGVVPASGTRVLQQRQAQTFVLTATSYFGPRTKASLEVDVSRTAPVIHDFRAAPMLFRQGLETVLTWKVSGAESVRLEPDGDSLPPSGSRTLRPDKTTRFILRAVSWYGIAVMRHIDVSVVRKTTLSQRQPTQLDWSRVTKLPPRR